MNKDWAGNKVSVFATLGAGNHFDSEREQNDYYATDPIALEKLLEHETFSDNVWECACGEGNLSEVLKKNGYNVWSSDLIHRGYGEDTIDFLKYNETFDGDIITNPPYKFAREFVEHAIEIIPSGNRVAMLLKLQFLETKKRRELFNKYPPRFVYVSTNRICCCKNNDFSPEQRKNNSAQAYAWFIWEKGYIGDTIIKWFN